MTAWEKTEVKGKNHSSFQKILQGPQEPCADFLARLQEAINKQIINPVAADVILQIMAFENVNKDCQRVIGAQKGKTDAMGYLRLGQEVGTEDPKAALLANAITGAFQKKDKFSGTCYNCGKEF